MSNIIKAIFFDLDGTLIDTEPTAVDAIQKVFERWQVPLSPEDSTFVTGRKWKDAFDYLFQKYKIPVAHWTASEEILSEYRQSLGKNLRVVPGGIRAVQSLSQLYPLGLVSGSHRAEIIWALSQMGIQKNFQVVLGAEDYLKSKPAPDGYLKALEILNLPASDALVFEDSHAGISAARKAGLWVVAITKTNHFLQDLSQAHLQIPDLTVVTPKWLAELMNRLS